MKEFRILLAVFCLVLSISINAQGDFRPGYIINIDKDTIYGQIKSNSESRNARTCVFRTGEDTQTTQYDPGDLVAYRIEGGKYYISATIEEEGEQVQVFLEYLVNGMADLYYLRKENSETYYIQKQGEEAMALTDIRLLKAAFSDCYEIQSSLDNASLSHKSLVDMTVKYHDYVCDGEVCINYAKDASKVWIKVGPIVGFTMKSLSLKGDRIFDMFDFGSSSAPVFGILLNLGSDRLGQNFSFQMGTEFSKLSYEAYAERPDDIYPSTSYTYDAHLEPSMLSLLLGAKYSFSGNKVRPNLGGGLEFSKFINPDFYYIQDTHVYDNVTSSTWRGDVVRNILFGAYVQAGLDVKISNRMVLVSALRAGFLTSNPNTLAGGDGEQMRIRPQMIPLTLYIGILF